MCIGLGKNCNLLHTFIRLNYIVLGEINTYPNGPNGTWTLIQTDFILGRIDQTIYFHSFFLVKSCIFRTQFFQNMTNVEKTR